MNFSRRLTIALPFFLVLSATTFLAYGSGRCLEVFQETTSSPLVFQVDRPFLGKEDLTKLREMYTALPSKRPIDEFDMINSHPFRPYEFKVVVDEKNRISLKEIVPAKVSSESFVLSEGRLLSESETNEVSKTHRELLEALLIQSIERLVYSTPKALAFFKRGNTIAKIVAMRYYFKPGHEEPGVPVGWHHDDFSYQGWLLLGQPKGIAGGFLLENRESGARVDISQETNRPVFWEGKRFWHSVEPVRMVSGEQDSRIYQTRDVIQIGFYQGERVPVWRTQ